jgi:prepilin-type N-terminal cleavage/methylation domain-containing protein
MIAPNSFRDRRDGCPTAPGRVRAFTLIELLVVIGIMALLAGMVVMLAQHASEVKKISTVKTKLQGLVTMIDMYHQKLGFYPPSGAGPFAPAVTPLYYELMGTEQSPDGNFYTTLSSTTMPTKDTLARTVVQQAFGMDGLVNTATEKGEASSFGRTIPLGDLVEVKPPGLNAPVKLFRVPVLGPPPFQDPNVWHYNSVKPVHNPNSYDLWAEFLIGSKTNIIGNWKQ